MKIIIETDGDTSDISDYMKCIKIDSKLIKSIKFENED